MYVQKHSKGQAVCMFINTAKDRQCVCILGRVCIWARLCMFRQCMCSNLIIYVQVRCIYVQTRWNASSHFCFRIFKPDGVTVQARFGFKPGCVHSLCRKRNWRERTSTCAMCVTANRTLCAPFSSRHCHPSSTCSYSDLFLMCEYTEFTDTVLKY